MNLVTAESHAASRRRAPDRGGLVRRQDGIRREQAEPGGGSLLRRLGAGRIADGPAEHLESAADADDRRAALVLADYPVRQSDAPQPAEIGNRILAAGQH